MCGVHAVAADATGQENEHEINSLLLKNFGFHHFDFV